MTNVDYLKKNIPPFNEVQLMVLLYKSMAVYTISAVVIIVLRTTDFIPKQYEEWIYLAFAFPYILSVLFYSLICYGFLCNLVISFYVVWQCKKHARFKYAEIQNKMRYYAAEMDFRDYSQVGDKEKAHIADARREFFKNRIERQYDQFAA